MSHLPPNIARKTQSWFRPHSLGGLVGMACGGAFPLILAIFNLPVSGPGMAALSFGLMTLAIAVDVHVYLARLLRVVRDTPATPVGRAKRGYTKLSGTAEAIAGRLLTSPLRGTPCVWHVLEDRAGRRGSYSSGSPFLLRDASGQCLVDVDGAQVYGRKAPRATSVAGGWKFSEHVIPAGDPVHAIGDFAYVAAADAPRPRNAALAGQPDRVQDSEEAWERAMDYEYVDEASRDVGGLPAELGSTVKVLRRPVTGKPFLIMTGEQKAAEGWFTRRLWVARLLALAALALVVGAFVPARWIA